MPQVIVNTKFYDYSQNNSGGRLDVDDSAGIGHYVIVEATDSGDADRRAEKIGIYFDGVDDEKDCSCCGDRWASARYDKGTEEPTLYGQPIDKLEYVYNETICYIHRIKGGFEKVVIQPKRR